MRLGFWGVEEFLTADIEGVRVEGPTVGTIDLRPTFLLSPNCSLVWRSARPHIPDAIPC
jgi:hypothetical protein